MINYNFDRIFKAKGINKPFAFLKSAGFSDNLASKIKNNNVARLNMSSLERLCVALFCTPNDLMEWIPENNQTVDSKHPMNIIRKPEIEIDLAKTISSIPIGKLGEIEKMIREKLNEE